MTHSKKARNGKGALSTRGNAKARKRSAGQGKNIKATKISQEAAGVTDTLLARATGEKILGKPVYLVDTHPVNHDSGFLEKRLCDGPTFTAGTACGYSCQYCYVESQVRLQKPTKDALKLSGRPFNEIVIRRAGVLPRLAEDLIQAKREKDQLPSAKSLIPPASAKKWGLKSKWLKDRVPRYKGTEWKGKVIYGSPLVDIAATKELALETVEMCDMILRLTDLDIRLLSKSPLLATVVVKELAERFPDTKNGAKARLILGFSTGTLDDGVASAIERPIPLPSARLKALHGLARLQKRLREQIGVEEVLVGLPGLLPKAVEFRELLDCDGVGHLEAEQEIVRGLGDHAFQILLAGKGVVGGIDADGLEDLGVFRKRVPLESSLGKLAPVFVAGAVVDRSAPAGVLP